METVKTRAARNVMLVSALVSGLLIPAPARATTRGDFVACTPDGGDGPSGGTMTVACTVTDELDRSVAGAPITFSEVGPGSLSSSSCTTGTDGRCEIASQTATNETGTQTITGVLTSGACDSTGQPMPGTSSECSDTATIAWSPSHPPAECSDGVDNDGDGEIDLNDRDCRSADDPSEAPLTQTSVTLRYKRRPPRGFTGQVGTGYARCQRGRRVVIRRTDHGIVGRDRTDGDGNFFVPFPPRRGFYQARVLERTVTINGEPFTCSADRSPVIRTRRR
jgi:hypothetical protein